VFYFILRHEILNYQKNDASSRLENRDFIKILGIIMKYNLKETFT